MFTKKAQAAALGVLIIGILIVGYLTLMPKSDKCKNNPDLPECSESSYVNESEALLNEAPGLLQPLEDSVEYSLGSIDLFMRESTEIPFAISLDPTVEKSWFNSKKITQEFEVPGKAKRVIVIVGIAESEGFASLSIIINGHVVERIVGAGAHFVEVPNDVISRNNILEIVPSTPILPGVTNKFDINYLALKETYTTTQPQIERSFMIEQDVNDVLSAVLTFNGNCYSEDSLKVKLNNDTIVNEKICTEYSNDVMSALAKSNTISFESEGNYFLSDVNLKVKFKQKDYVTYYFSVNKDNFERIDDGKVLAFLKLRFPDNEKKKFVVSINGNPINIDTSNLEYKTAVTLLLKKGQNSIRIVPDTKVSIGSLSIELE
ncbi:MAG: hypothetical protein V1660_01460 [archaeon]